MSPIASSTYALSYVDFKSETVDEKSDWFKCYPTKWLLFENLPNPSFIKYGVRRKFWARFSRTSSREFSRLFAVEQSPLKKAAHHSYVSTISCISLFHFRLLHRFWSLYTLYQGSLDNFQTQKVRQLTIRGRFDGQWSCNHSGSQFETLKCPSIVFLKPLLFSSFIQFTKFCSKKFPFWVLWMTATRLNGTTSTGFTGQPNTFRQPKSRKS